MFSITLFLSTTAVPVVGQDHYCGIYSVYSIVDQYGIEIEFIDLLETEFVSSYEGSTARDLLHALDKYGLAAREYSGLGSFDLKTANGPLLLHVRANQATRDYAHWVVYYGQRDGKAVILDPSTGIALRDYSEVLSLWDGVAIATERSGSSLLVWRTLGIAKQWILLVLLGVLAWLLTRHVDVMISKIALPPSIHPWATGAGLLATLFLVAIGCDLVSSESLLCSPDARASLSSVRTVEAPPVIHVHEAAELHGRSQRGAGRVAFVDARRAQDFETGRIPGAISMPINGDFASDRAAVGALANRDLTIVYCQSIKCGFADAISKRLQARGVDNIRHLEVGYAGWQENGNEIESGHGDVETKVGDLSPVPSVHENTIAGGR